jgi:hypothetical protein
MAAKPWLRIGDDEIKVEAVMEEIERRVAARRATSPASANTPEDTARRLYHEMLKNNDDRWILSSRDCEVLPRTYVIDWHIPILGPIHGLVRRVINAEIRRYLEAGLIRQTRFNREVLLEVQRLTQENRELQERIAALEAQEDRTD